MFQFMLKAINARIMKHPTGLGRSTCLSNSMKKRRPKHLDCVELEGRINPVLTVDSLADTSTTGTLRAAIEYINSNGPDDIVFDAMVFDVGGATILLTNNLPQLKYDTTITGFTDNSRVQINALFMGNHYDVFGTDNSVTTVDLDISGITIIGSQRGLYFDGGTHTVDNMKFDTLISTSDGAGIQVVNGASITVTNSLFDGCAAVGDGGAISITGSTVNLDTVVISSCSAGDDGVTTAAADGGAIFLNDGTLNLQNVSISDCSATRDGGGIHVVAGDIVSNLSTGETFSITGCSAGENGGGINVVDGTIQLTAADVDAVEISGCSAGISGGGINLGTGDIELENALIDDCDAVMTGGGINVNSTDDAVCSLELHSCTISNCSTTSSTSNGGGIYFTLGEVEISDSTIKSCTAQTYGGGIAMGIGTLTITDSTIGGSTSGDGCSSLFGGGGIAADLIMSDNNTLTRLTTLDHTLVQGCSAHNTGGGVLVGFNEQDASFLMINQSEINTCVADAIGGGMHFDEDMVSGTIQDSKVTDCSAGVGGGGGIYTGSGLRLRSAEVTGNTANGNGGGIYWQLGSVVGDVEMLNSTISSNLSYSHGGGLYFRDGEITLQGCTFTDNTAGANGGGMNIIGELDEILECTIENNDAANGGGVFYEDADDGGVLIIRQSTLAGNSATSNGGGLFFNTGNLTLEQSTLSGNTAEINGGGIYLIPTVSTSSSTVSIVNATISGNMAEGNGGGVFIDSLRDTVSFLFCTIIQNEAVDGGGIAIDTNYVTGSYNRTLTLDATILGDNTVSGSGSGIFADDSTFGNDVTISGDYNANCDANSVGAFVTDSLPAVDPALDDFTDLELGSLQDNGGLTKTHLPALTSPLIDFIPGAKYPTAYDQRGVPRPIDFTGNPNHDIGSVEVYGESTLQVASIVVNNGATQRSRLTTITVNFTDYVEADLFSFADMISLTRTKVKSIGSDTLGTKVRVGATGANGLIVVSPSSGYVNSITLTFANADSSNVTAGVEYGSLSDGRWQLSIPIANYFSPPASDTGSTNLRRLFGDIDNNGTVDATDYGYYPSFGSLVGSPFDWNNNSNIEITPDFSEFGNRFGATL